MLREPLGAFFCNGKNRQLGIDAKRSRRDASVNDKQPFDVMRLAMRVNDRSFRARSHPARSERMSAEECEIV